MLYEWNVCRVMSKNYKSNWSGKRSVEQKKGFLAVS